MAKLLILSDDFTGALDTGIQFVKYQAKTRIFVGSETDDIDFEKEDAEVLVVNLETRHLSKEKAYETVYKIVAKAVEAGIPYIYKKTDSVLRGNIGSELSAAIHAGGIKFLPFIPALPKMSRVTRGGIHYAENIPISDTVFGKDLYDPVLSSRVKDLFSGCDVQVAELSKSNHYDTDFKDNTIGVFDAENDQDVLRIAKHLKEKNQLHVMAGCAGFASVLSEVITLSKGSVTVPQLNNPLLVVCGSIHPVTRKQVEYAEKIGYKRVSLEPQQILEADYPDSGEGQQWIASFKEELKNNKVVMIDTGISNPEVYASYSKKMGIELTQAGKMIAKGLSRITKELIDEQWTGVVMVIGGDTLAQFFRATKCSEIELVCELEPGTVLSRVKLDEKMVWVISKSGGFGTENLIPVLVEKIEKMI